MSIIVRICDSALSGFDTSNSANTDNPALKDSNLPRGLLLIAGILIMLAEPIWLTINKQLSPAMLTGSRPFHFNLLWGFSLFNALLGFILLLTFHIRWLQLRWRIVAWLVWTSLILSCAVTARQTGDVDGFAELLICLLVINSMLCDCSLRWLGSLSAISIAAFVWLAASRQATAMEWFTVVVGVVVAHCGQEISIRNRREAESARAELEGRIAEVDAAKRRASQSEENLKRIIDYAPDVIMVNRYLDGGFILVNREFGKRFKESSALDRTAFYENLVLPRARMKEVMKELAQGTIARDVEFQYRKHDGTLEHYLASCILAEMNGEKCVITSARDVTAIKRIERKLRESEAMMRKIFDDNSDPMTVIDAESNTFVNANHAYLRFNGLASKQELVGAPPSRFVPRETVRRINRMLVQNGQIVNQEFEFPDKNGKLVPMLLSISTMELGGRLHYVTTVRDITTIREIQRQLHQSEAALRKIFEASPDCITLARLSNGTFQEVNDSFVKQFGFTREEAIGKNQRELGLWADPSQVKEVMRRLRIDGVITNVELNLRRKNGTILPCLFSAALTEIGSELCVVAIVHDITELKRTEEDLVQAREAALAASRAKSEFLSSMSHEIRTPMNAVLGMADLLADTELSIEQRRYLDIMVANGNALLELINSILDLAKIEAGRMRIETTDFDLTDLIEKTISTFGIRAHGKGLELAARIEPGVPDHLTGDPLRLRQILINLLGNAVKFTEVGQVILEVAKAPGSDWPGDLMFTVTDTGIGISQDKLEQIFSSFAQADSSTTRKYGGSGLGLAIAKRLTELMGGQIMVESEIGKGSKFSFTAQFGLAPRILSPTTRVVLSLSGCRALVADDNQINRLIVRELMTGCGAEIDEAESGEQAIEAVMKAGGHPYQIILLDMRMPGIDGLEVARRIRAAHLPTEPVILMLSSDDVKPQLTRLKDLGLDAYLIKPITRRELFEAIRRLLQNANRGTASAMPQRLITGVNNGTGGMRILVAEDSVDNRLLIQAYLRHSLHQIDIAENGRVAVDKYITQPYDLVFMDMQMPELDGLDATRMIREWERRHGNRPSPIIALTASVLDEDVKRALAAGCTSHIGKPVKKQSILDAIRAAQCCDRSPARNPKPVSVLSEVHN
ncbi:MAG: PAS domain S-box protein [Deltaproteobacteria bacterium]|nr:PAS domain S-box protein [Deltaproteobacteria bacterium]